MISCGRPAGVIACLAGAAPHSAVGIILNSGTVKPPSVVDRPDGACRGVGEEGESLGGFRLGVRTGAISHLVPRRSRLPPQRRRADWRTHGLPGARVDAAARPEGTVPTAAGPESIAPWPLCAAGAGVGVPCADALASSGSAISAPASPFATVRSALPRMTCAKRSLKPAAKAK